VTMSSVYKPPRPTLGCYATTYQSDCYNDAALAHERREENRALPPSRNNVRPPTSLKVNGQTYQMGYFEHR